MPENTENHDLIHAAQEAVEPRALDGARGVWAVHQSQRVVDLADTLERRQARPDRKTGVFCFTDVESVVGHILKHAMPETEIYADVDSDSVTAVINAHEAWADGEPSDSMAYAGLAGWGDHRAVLTLRRTEDWVEWTARDRKWMAQTEFAEFIEQQIPNCVAPVGAEMLELAQTFKATKATKFEQSRRLKSGETKLEWREDIEAKAGPRGSLDIPDEIHVALRPYECSPAYRVAARLRYRIDGGDLRLSFVLIRPRDVLLEAFGEVVKAVGTGTARPVWRGAHA